MGIVVAEPTAVVYAVVVVVFVVVAGDGSTAVALLLVLLLRTHQHPVAHLDYVLATFPPELYSSKRSHDRRGRHTNANTASLMFQVDGEAQTILCRLRLTLCRL